MVSFLAVRPELASQPDPLSPYAVSKLSAEYYVRTIGTLWGIETVVLRVFNVYGPGQPLPAAHPPVVPNFLRRTVRGGTLVIHGKGQQTRDFVYVTDAIEAMVSAATAPSIDQSIINIGSGVETSIRELAQEALETVGSSGEWLYKEDQDPGSSRMCADISRAQKKLGYRPVVTLHEGLERMVAQDPRFQPATVE